MWCGLVRKAHRPLKEYGLIVSPWPGGEPLYKMAALWVGSRRLPGISRGVAVLWAFVSPQQNRRDGPNIAVGHSREPPASNPIELPDYKVACPT
jgi:hypothetical protein